MNVCFLMYPWEKIEPGKDSTLTLIHECVKRGHRVAIATPSNLTIRESIAYGFCKIVKNNGEKFSNSPKVFYKNAILQEFIKDISGRDLRVYTRGGKVIACIEITLEIFPNRYNKGNVHDNNYSE